MSSQNRSDNGDNEEEGIKGELRYNDFVIF